MLLTLGCVSDVQVHRAPDPSEKERYCAWFGAEADGILYFGQAGFWSALRAGGRDPRADLEEPGPQRIGRFDLTARRLLSALDVGGEDPHSGVWDVLPLGGRVYFTTYFEGAGSVELATGVVTRAPHGLYWNELSVGPPGSILVSRYADAGSGGGAVLVVSPGLEVLEEHRLEAPAGEAFAAKSPAWDPIRDELWVTTDRLPLPTDGTLAYPTLVLNREGREVARFGTRGAPAEIHFVRFDRRGRGFLALVTEGRLELVLLEPDSDRRDLTGAKRVLLDEDFPAGLDFAQDIHLDASGSAFVTRWSGRVHRVSPTGKLRTWQLPRNPGDLYYTAVPTADGVCATRCGDVEVVCSDRPVEAERR